MSPVARTVALCLVFVSIVLGMLYYSITRVPVLSEDQLREMGVFLLPRPREIAPFELTTHTGEPFTVEDLQGRWSFIFFGFTNCPDICPTTMSVMGVAERDLVAGGMDDGAPFQGLLVTVDPERDDAETLAHYVQAFSPRFLGVRGDREATAKFATQLNAAFAQVPDPSGSGYQVDHTANIVIVNPRGHYHGFVRMPHKAETLIAAYRSLAATF
jgi:protein SCO1/2